MLSKSVDTESQVHEACDRVLMSKLRRKHRLSVARTILPETYRLANTEFMSCSGVNLTLSATPQHLHFLTELSIRLLNFMPPNTMFSWHLKVQNSHAIDVELALLACFGFLCTCPCMANTDAIHAGHSTWRFTPISHTPMTSGLPYVPLETCRIH